MGKRSNFKRVEKDFYRTPPSAVEPLRTLVGANVKYYEPCAGDGALVDGLRHANIGDCVGMSDIAPQALQIAVKDALDISEADLKNAGYIITNPPWSRDLLHPMIEHFASLRPTWLLFDADWMHTLQSRPYMLYCHKIKSIGRVKWIPDSPHTGKDNAAWYLFDSNAPHSGTRFYGR